MDLLKEYMYEHAKELGCLAIDLVLFGVSSHMYNRYRTNISHIQQAKGKGVNNQYTYGELENNRTYGIVQGTITPIGTPLRSIYDSDITGVVSKLTISEHVTSRSRYGYWGDTTRVLHEKSNMSPFCLVQDKFRIVVQDALQADQIDMNVTYDKFEHSSASVMDLLMVFVSGTRQRGIQTTEEMLRLGAVVNIVGDILVAKDNSLTLVAPQDKPFYILSDSVQTLLSSLQTSKQVCKTFAILFGTVAVALVFFRSREIYAKYAAKKLKAENERRLKETRAKRRAATRDSEVIEELRCVICQSNGREIVLMPCGHFCLCEDCNENVFTLCPMCRTPIQERIPTYL